MNAAANDFAQVRALADHQGAQHGGETGDVVADQQWHKEVGPENHHQQRDTAQYVHPYGGEPAQRCRWGNPRHCQQKPKTKAKISVHSGLSH